MEKINNQINNNKKKRNGETMITCCRIIHSSILKLRADPKKKFKEKKIIYY